MNTIMFYASCLIPSVLMLVSSSTKNDFWYDIYNFYYSLADIWTVRMDKFLMNNPNFCEVNSKIISNTGIMIPDVGYHYIYIEHVKERDLIFPSRIGVYKKKEIINDKEIYRYILWMPSSIKSYVHNILKELTDQKQNTIESYSIDTSSITPIIRTINKIYYTPLPTQQLVINEIMLHYQQPHFNTKVFLYGQSGIGKTYTSYGLKKIIENTYKHVILYDNFNPSISGVSIESLLENVNDKTTVILVINEINIAYFNALANKQSFDPRSSYTNDKQSLTDMLDLLAQCKRLITIFTSEKSPQELLIENNEYYSFMRKGRIDLYIEMKDNDNINVINDIQKIKN